MIYRDFVTLDAVSSALLWSVEPDYKNPVILKRVIIFPRTDESKQEEMESVMSQHLASVPDVRDMNHHEKKVAFGLIESVRYWLTMNYGSHSRRGQARVRSITGDSWDFLDFSNLSRFRLDVYSTLAEVPAGSVVSYSRLALEAGYRGAARAVGSAMAANRFPLIIPCHRVVRADGSPGAFSGGTDLKTRLLAFESVRPGVNGRIDMATFTWKTEEIE